MERLIITIDGPAASGKSTVGHLLAKRLGCAFLDTGAMYRAAALASIEGGLAPGDGPGIVERIRQVGLGFAWGDDPPTIQLGGRNVASRVRDEDVAKRVSAVADQREVRELLSGMQREIGDARQKLVTEGRDQGSIVFPDANLKFYIKAAPEIRAARRAAQMREKNLEVDEAAVLNDIVERDRRDSEREIGRLQKAQGAIEVNTDRFNLGEVVDELERLVKAHLGMGDAERSPLIETKPSAEGGAGVGKLQTGPAAMRGR